MKNDMMDDMINGIITMVNLPKPHLAFRLLLRVNTLDLGDRDGLSVCVFNDGPFGDCLFSRSTTGL